MFKFKWGILVRVEGAMLDSYVMEHCKFLLFQCVLVERVLSFKSDQLTMKLKLNINIKHVELVVCTEGGKL